MSIERQLAEFAHEPVGPCPAREVMALSLMDWAACARAGLGEPVARILRAHVSGTGPSTLIGGGRVPAASAALVNGAISHALDYDDTHFAHIGHTSVAVVPAALAMAEAEGARFDALLEACLVGAEAAVRVGLWLGRDHYQVGFHQTATSGAFGAAVACARLGGLSLEQTVCALGLAATRAAGLKSQFGTMGKPYNAGLAAQTGVEAALLARAGMTSSALGLSGPQGFGLTHHGAADGAAFEGLGEVWRFGEVHHKYHACCHGLHAMLEALGGVSVPPGAVVNAVRVRTHPRWLSVCNIAAPRTGLEAKFSYAQTAAMRLSGIETGDIASFSDALARDAGLVALRDRVEVTAAPELSELQAEVEIELAGQAPVRVAHDLAAPIPMEQRAAKLEAKARMLMGPEADTLLAGLAARDIGAIVAVLAA